MRLIHQIGNRYDCRNALKSKSENEFEDIKEYCIKIKENLNKFLTIYIYIYIYKAALMVYGSYQTIGRIRAVVAGLCHSHSNARYKPRLQPTSQLMATPDP